MGSDVGKYVSLDVILIFFRFAVYRRPALNIGLYASISIRCRRIVPTTTESGAVSDGVRQANNHSIFHAGPMIIHTICNTAHDREAVVGISQEDNWKLVVGPGFVRCWQTNKNLVISMQTRCRNGRDLSVFQNVSVAHLWIVSRINGKWYDG